MIRLWRRFSSTTTGKGSSSVIPSLYRTVKEVLGENPSIGSETKLHGWVRSVRKQKEIAFVTLGDGSTHKTVQAVASPEQVADVSTGASIQLQGLWTESPGSKQAKEIKVTQLNVVGHSDSRTFPLQKKYHTSDYLRTIPALRWRTAVYSSMIRARSEIIWRITQFFRDANFLQVNTPIITTSDCEGAGEVFQVTTKRGDKSSKEEYFDQPAYLTVSGQLHLEAVANAVTRVWTMGPAFRAEPSVTNRHLSEFWMVEAEAAFTHDLNQIMDICEQMVRHTAQALVDTPAGDDLLTSRRQYYNSSGQQASSMAIDDKQLQVRWELLTEPNKYRRITYSQGIKECQAAMNADSSIFEHGAPKEGDDLHSEHEKWLARNCPVFVTHYPRHLKPFYMLPHKTNKEIVECFDLMVPEMGELAGGSLRQHLPEELEQAIKTREMEIAPLQWYLDIGRYGAVPHGGFGVGLDRLVCYLTGTSNLRETALFPRWAGHCP